MSRLFISHAGTNKAEAVAIRDWLTEAGWNDVFLDLDPERGIMPGERWEQALTEAGSRCEAVVFLISRAWLDSEFCREEFNRARILNKALFGAIVAKDIDIDGLPDRLKATWQVVDLAIGQDHRTFRVTLPLTHEEARVTFSQEGLARLRLGLDKAGLEPRFFAWPPEGDPDRAPYRGLRPLDAEDAGIFFGREAPIIEALDRLRGLRGAAPPRLLVILGASGSGKSSFLRAGLLPRLGRDDRNFLPLPVIRPERAALTGESGLVHALEEALAAHGMAQQRAEIRAAVSGGAEGVRPLLQRLVDRAFVRTLAEESGVRPPAVVLAIDQAEELFSSDGLAEGEALLGLARDLAKEDRPATIVLFTIRTNSYDQLETAEALEGVGQQTLPLLPMPRGAYQTVIEGPAARLRESGRKLAIDPRLTQRLLEDIEKGGGSDALPLLAFTLEQLYLDYGRGSGELRLADYEAFGGIKGAIEAAVERALKEADADPRIPRDRDARLALLRRGLIPWLAGIDPETGSPRRRLARLAEVPPESAPLIRLLVEQRLLSTDRITVREGDRERHEITIEPAHEALLRTWSLLHGWLEEDFGALTTLEGVKRAARDWAANAKGTEWLSHTGTRLDEAEQFAARPDLAGDLSADARDYLRQCRAREEAERKEKEEALAREQARLAEIAAAQARTARFQRVAAWALAAVLLVVTVGVGAVVWQQDRLNERQVALNEQGMANKALQADLNLRQRALDDTHVNLLAELAAGEQLHGDPDAALRFAVYGAQLGLRLDPHLVRTPFAGTELAAAISQLGWRLVLSGHEDRLTSAAFSPDGLRIVTASSDNTARVWHAGTGKEVAILRGHEDVVHSAAFSPDGSRIVTASSDKTARIWDAVTGVERIVLRGHEDKVISAAFSPDGLRIVTASADKTARLWDTATGKQIAVLYGHDDGISSAVFSADGSRIVTASFDKTARIWDAATGKEIAVLREPQTGNEPGFAFAAFSPDGSRVVTASLNLTAQIWDSASVKEVALLRGHEGYVLCAQYSPDGSRIVTASWDKTARVWDAKTANLIAVLRGHEKPVWTASFSPDGSRVVTASLDGTARIWDLATGNEVAVLRGHRGQLASAAFGPRGSRIVTAGSEGLAAIWDMVTTKVTAVLRGHEDVVSSAAFSPDGALIVTASWDRTARIWDAATAKENAVLRGHEARVNSAAFSPDGSRIVTRRRTTKQRGSGTPRSPQRLLPYAATTPR